jgi:hypothetical protein
VLLGQTTPLGGAAIPSFGGHGLSSLSRPFGPALGLLGL